MMIQAAIFDMDGLLLDTERVCIKIFQQACEAQGVEFDEALYLSTIGCNAQLIEEKFRQGYGSSLDYSALQEEWKERYFAVVKHQAIPAKEGVIELLEWLKENRIPTAVATSSERDVAKAKLKLAGLDHYFDALATGCEVTNSKPDPEIYLLAAQRLGVEPSQCMAFEDSNNGVRSAVAANMITYQVPDLVAPTDEITALGHSIVISLLDVLELLKRPNE